MGKTLRITGYVFLATLVLALAWAALNWQLVVQIARFSPIILPPMYGTPETEAEARTQDIQYLRKLIKIDRSFSDSARVEFSHVLDDLDKRTKNMSDAELYLGASKAVALADNGHTNVSAAPLYKRFNGIGAKLYWFSDGLFVVRSDRRHADTVGSRVIAVDGLPVQDVVERLRPYRGGVAQWRELYMPMMIESPEILYAAGLAERPGSVTLSLESEPGVIRDVTFEGHEVENGEALPVRRPWMSLIPRALPGEDETWVRALSVDDKEAPLYLRDSDTQLYLTRLGDRSLYLRTQTALGTETQSVATFYKTVLAGTGDGSLDFLVVDMRWNPGGDYTRAIDFAKRVPAKIKTGGRLYIVVGPQTFSAALVTAAFLKYYGGDKSLIIGMPMGDREQFWAESGMEFRLPNSKFRVGYATGYHDWNTGCEGHLYCFTQNLIHQVPAGSLAPSVTLSPTFSDYASGRDVVMDWVLQHEGVIK